MTRLKMLKLNLYFQWLGFIAQLVLLTINPSFIILFCAGWQILNVRMAINGLRREKEKLPQIESTKDKYLEAGTWQ